MERAVRLRICVVLAVTLFASWTAAPAGRSQLPTDLLFVFHLSGDQMVPPQPNTAAGGCLGAFNAAQTQFTLTCVHNVPSATLIHLHLGPAGVNGPIVFDLGSPASPVTATWTGMTPANAADLLAGNLYISIKSAAAPAGAIRGQVLPRTVDTVAFSMNGSQVVPPSGSAASGNCIADLSASATSLAIQCTHNVASPTIAHGHEAPFGANGPIFFAFPSAASPLSANPTLSAVQIAEFAAGFLYLDVHSAGFPAGEIRGQISSGAIAPQPGTIRITKVTVPAGGTGFGFTDNVPGSTGTFTLAHNETRTFTDVPSGTYSVTENDPGTTPGSYVLNSVSCDDANSTGTVASRNATIRLEAGETVTCTFENRPSIPVPAMPVWMLAILALLLLAAARLTTRRTAGSA